jgi:hypothetical protein
MGSAENPGERRSLLPVVVLVLLPVLYVASLGPVVGLYEHGIISGSTFNDIVWTAYFPLACLEETDFFDTPPGSAYMWYLSLFEP